MVGYRLPAETGSQVLQVSLTAGFNLCREVGAHMLERAPGSSGRRGSIINLVSVLSFQGGLTVLAYAASKGGAAQLTEAFLNEWAAKGIAVNAIAPGYIATEMNIGIGGRRSTGKEYSGKDSSM